MRFEYQLRSILLYSRAHADLPVAGTDPAQGPNSGPVGREWSPVAGSRAESLRLCRADVALGSSGPGNSAWELKRIEGCPVSESRGRFSEMPEESGAVKKAIHCVDTKIVTNELLPGFSQRETITKWRIKGPTSQLPPTLARGMAWGNLPRATSVRLCHRSLTASGPPNSWAWSAQRNGNQLGPSNLGGLRLMVKRPMATATGMATGNLLPFVTIRYRQKGKKHGVLKPQRP